MSERLKILISAYACEPGKGSEPEVGWQWATRMARDHDVTVLTRSNNRPAIEAAVGGGGVENLRFVYLDAPALFLRLKKKLGWAQGYYQLWQFLAHRRIAALCTAQTFHLIHHVTFASCRFRTAIWGHGLPSLWGPVGGMESAPWNLLPWGKPLECLKEAARNLDNLAQLLPWSRLARRARKSTFVLAASREVARALERHRIPHELFPTIGLERKLIHDGGRKPSDGPLRLLFVGGLLWLKGMDLALAALAQTKGGAQLSFVGRGTSAVERELRSVAERLGLTRRVEFVGQLPREEVLSRYAQHDVFLFPSQHDSGGFAVIEAMAAGLPVICLDCGGPAIAVADGCGRRISLGSRQQVIAGLARAIDEYDADRQRVAADGERARLRILDEYEWEAKARHMDGIYRRVVGA